MRKYKIKKERIVSEIPEVLEKELDYNCGNAACGKVFKVRIGQKIICPFCHWDGGYKV